MSRKRGESMEKRARENARAIRRDAKAERKQLTWTKKAEQRERAALLDREAS